MRFTDVFKAKTNLFYFIGNGVVDFDEFLVMMAAKVVEGGQPGISWAHKVPIPYIWDQSFATLVSLHDQFHQHYYCSIYVVKFTRC